MKYENTWESLDQRPVPQWFADAKFGIFIHWGLYSVPAFAKKNQFSEWFLNFARSGNPEYAEYADYLKRVYGENFEYEDFATMFRAENFHADEWVNLFERAGARYMNLVSKHHDGFCMYKSSYAWNWNSVDIGPHRDFCAELKEACEGSKVRFGVYHSIYEWYHPLYLENPERYAVEHLIPMMKELIEKYQPATLFTDGEWCYPDEVWHSREFLQWLYNESSVRDFIVPNDRWGRGTRGHHGGNYTTEYGVIDSSTDSVYDPDRPSEECRGIGGSFGWNRFETVEDYMSEEKLIKMFVDLISRGSNMLLNIGPTADGRIPVIMQERLLQMGAWLDVNGEGIYGTRKYVVKKDGVVRYTRKDKTLYAFVMKYPFGDIVMDDVPFKPGIKAKLLGYDGDIAVAEENGKTVLRFGAINPEQIRSRCVYGVRLDGCLD